MPISPRASAIGLPALRASRRARCSWADRKSTRLNSSHANISYAVFCLKKKTLRADHDVEGARAGNTGRGVRRRVGLDAFVARRPDAAHQTVVVGVLQRGCDEPLIRTAG